MPFEKGRGHIHVDTVYIFAFFTDNVDRSFKVPLTVAKEPNIKSLHEVLKMANLAKYYLTEEALKTFDKLVEEWKGNETRT